MLHKISENYPFHAERLKSICYICGKLTAMKHISGLFQISLAALLLVSCGGGDNTTSEKHIAVPDVQTDGGIHRMSDYEFTDTVDWNGAKCVYHIVRLACDSLGTVTDTDGTKYVENTLSLTLSRGGARIFERAFSKGSIKQYVDSVFLKHSIVEGMAFNKITPEGICFAISVGLPLSDEYVQLRLTVHADGTSTLRRDEIVDDNLADDDSLGLSSI